MKITDMLVIWADRTNSIAADGSARLDYPEGSVGLQGGSTGTWGTAFDEWEEEHEGSIKSSLDALIYGVGKDRGILTDSERYAVEANHIDGAPHVFVSNRGLTLDDFYTRALFKLKPAMAKRGFLVE